MDDLRLTLFQTDDIHTELEIYNDVPYLHCTVTNWSKSKYKEFLNYWYLTEVELERKGIDYLFCVSPNSKVTKFAEMFGFKVIVSGENDIMFKRFKHG